MLPWIYQTHTRYIPLLYLVIICHKTFLQQILYLSRYIPVNIPGVCQVYIIYQIYTGNIPSIYTCYTLSMLLCKAKVYKPGVLISYSKIKHWWYDHWYPKLKKGVFLSFVILQNNVCHLQMLCLSYIMFIPVIFQYFVFRYQ